MAKRIFLHVGTPKTGTTYLQRLLWSNKHVLEEQGLLLPLKNVRDHYYLSVLGRDLDKEEDRADLPPRALPLWERMAEQVANWDGDVLVSHELFAMTLAPKAKTILDNLSGVAGEVHTIITARDLARQVPAEWQQTIKHGRTHRLREFYGIIRSDNPLLFWRAQDLPDQVRRWGQGIPPEHLHLITVPPAGGTSDVLWTRFASVIGIDPDSVEPPEKIENLSLGLVEIETLRRVNFHSPMGTTKPLRQLMIRQVLGDGVLARRPDPKRFAPPEDEHAWVVQTGTAMVDELRTMPCDVVGDLDELLPPSEPVKGPLPDDVADAEVAEVAIETISNILYGEHAEAIDEIKRLHERLAAKNDELRKSREATQQTRQEMQREVQKARQALQAERAVPLWRHAARRVRAAWRAVLPHRWS
jgi:hypothetical protein